MRIEDIKDFDDVIEVQNDMMNGKHEPASKETLAEIAKEIAEIKKQDVKERE